MTGEFELIAKLIRNWNLGDDVRIGPGDDASAIEIKEGADTLLLQTTDLLIENIHFRKEWCSPYQLGWKSLAVNLSDIAAMGGNPLHTHLSLAVPDTWSEPELLALMEGFKALANQHSVSLIGGNLSKSPDPLVITAVVDGTVRRDQVVRRNGAQPGDIVWVSGFLGAAAAGLEVLKRQLKQDFDDDALNPFLTPVPEIELGQFCAKNRSVNAMIDLSDGLTGDLGHILNASKVGAVILEDQLPISKFSEQVAGILDTRAIEYALRGGEDYHLLGCTPESHFTTVLKEVKTALDRTIYPVGQITKESGLRFHSKSGHIREIPPKAHDHFIA